MNLELYGIEKRSSDEGIPLVHILNKDILMPVVQQYATSLGTESLAIAGSLFIKRYAVLAAAASLDYFGLQKETKDWWTTARFEPKTFKLLIEEDVQKEWAEDWKERLFAEHLTPLVELVAKECKVPQNILWENIAVRLQAVLRKQGKLYSNFELEQQFKELTCLEAHWLGRTGNPLRMYLQKGQEWSQMPTRKTCCRYYQVKKEDENPYCGNCPLKKD
ncbi:IucA/IucC family C-terminal-domain containing protein [Lysinibacillus sp. LZ02]|uniref:IucA/IucC family C-terminal-domain containing protein n=1 Tax=Lysinibacillus sp. LZ02 TaxID=3420668 RepID=UPI003D35F6E8